MMIFAYELLAGPGTFLIAANCIEPSQAIPDGQSEYFSKTMPPPQDNFASVTAVTTNTVSGTATYSVEPVRKN